MADEKTKRSKCPSHWAMAKRIDHYLDKSGGVEACWPFMGARHTRGYGRILEFGTPRLVHRLQWKYLNGAIPIGMDVCHRCDNPPCCNPAHLWIGSRGDNNKDRVIKGRSASKLTEDQVREIRKTSAPQRVVAAQFGVSRATIGLIRQRLIWAHIHD